MSLRSRILTLYLALAFIPMLVVSVGNYAQAMRSLTDLVHGKLAAASSQGAMEINARHRELSASLRLISESRFAREVVRGEDASGAAGELPWSDVWSVLGPSFESVELVDARGVVRHAVRSPLPDSGLSRGACPGPAQPVGIRVDVNVDGAVAGVVVGRVRPAALIPDEVLRGWFGRNGQRLLVDRGSGVVLFDARCAAGDVESRRPPVSAWAWTQGGSGEGRVTIAEDGIEKAGAFAEASALPWTVVSVADIEEFTGPYRREQLAYLAFVMFIVLAAGAAFVILAQQVMSSLEELTRASEQIGEGELTPWLPPPGPDEVGRLSQAFGTMLARLKVMMRQNEVARRLAVAGDVAARLSHEIRNPLSSIRLNLQSIAREVRSGSVPADLPQVVSLCLREIDRLDDAVGSVLELGEPKAPDLRPCRLAAPARDALDVVAPRLQARLIDVQLADTGESDRVFGDETQLRGVFLNLFLNAADSMSRGGTLRVWTERGPGPAGEEEVRVHVADSGEGVRPELRQLVFEPFFSTRGGGSGIGLSAALQVVEAHGGRLYLADGREGVTGAEFVVALPAAPGAMTPAVEAEERAGRWMAAGANVEHLNP